MVLQVPLVLLLIAVAASLVRRARLKVGHALLCVLLGFHLAKSRAGPKTGRFLESLAEALEGIHL